jgi:hypothetical protein
MNKELIEKFIKKADAALDMSMKVLESITDLLEKENINIEITQSEDIDRIFSEYFAARTELKVEVNKN